MGSWGILERQSDYGLDLLSAIVETQLKAADFAAFHVADALEAVKADIMEEIRLANRGGSAEDLVLYFSEHFPHRFTHGALLIAECLVDYYRTGDLVVTEYAGERHTPVDHHIKEFIISVNDLNTLLSELQKVQDPEHPIYRSWIQEETRQEWLEHIRAEYQILSEHL